MIQQWVYRIDDLLQRLMTVWHDLDQCYQMECQWSMVTSLDGLRINADVEQFKHRL